MTRFQKRSLIIGVLILIVLLAIVAMLVVPPRIFCCISTEGALPGQSDFEVAATQTEAADR